MKWNCLTSGGFILFVSAIFILRTLFADEKADKDEVICHLPSLGQMAFRIPAREDIKHVQVELFNLDGPDIKQFIIDDEYVDDVYWLIDDCKVDSIPYIVYPDFGSIRLVLKSGEVITFAMHQTASKTPQQFSILGVRLRQNHEKWEKNKSRSDFESFVRRMYYQQTGNFTFDVPKEIREQHSLRRPVP